MDKIDWAYIYHGFLAGNREVKITNASLLIKYGDYQDWRTISLDSPNAASLRLLYKYAITRQ